MSENSFNIFIVDDDDLLWVGIYDHLTDPSYQIHQFKTGAASLEELHLKPDLVLLNVEMPDQSGLEVCKEIRRSGYEDIHVIFLSGHEDLDTLLAIFEAGGNDFINKSVHKDILLQKVVLAIENAYGKLQLQDQLSFARRTAFTAMSSLGETGIVLEFLRSSFQCINLQQLADLLLRTLQQFNLRGLIKLSDAGEEHYFNSESLCSPLETSILHYVEKFNRVYQARDRLALNYPHISLLIVGLDMDDQEGQGRIRDHLATIAEAVGLRIDAMHGEQQRLRETNKRLENIKELTELFSQIELNQQANHRRLEVLIDAYMKRMEEAFSHLGVSDAQEAHLRGILEQLYSNLNPLFENDVRLALSLGEIVQKQKAILLSP